MENFEVVTEIGTFGSLNIDDPTVTKVAGKKKKRILPNGEVIEEEMDMDEVAKAILGK